MAEPIIGCPISEAQAERVRTTIAQLREAPESVDREAVVNLIVEITETSFDYHFQRPLRSLGTSTRIQKSIDFGLKGAMRVIRSSMRRVIGGLDRNGTAYLADFLEDAYFPNAENARS